MTTFAYFFAVQFVAYGLLCWSYRAIAQANYWHIAMADTMYAALAFTIIKDVAKAESRAAMAGYVMGGLAGSLFSVWLTTKVF